VELFQESKQYEKQGQKRLFKRWTHDRPSKTSTKPEAAQDGG
jgi:hypothetical protein